MEMYKNAEKTVMNYVGSDLIYTIMIINIVRVCLNQIFSICVYKFIKLCLFLIDQ